MRLYEVQLGDSQASIASKPTMAGCPKCGGIDFVRANPHKAAVKHPNGYVSFVELRVGEKLVLPEKWFTPEFDQLPPAYFAALPHPDGVTPSKLGTLAAGVLGDYATLDAASAKVGELSAMRSQPFSAAVNDTATAIDMSVREVDEGIGDAALRAGPYAQATRKSTGVGRQRNSDLLAAITAGNETVALQVRNAILHDFSDALSSARLALRTFYGSEAQPAGPIAGDVAASAKVAAAAITADPTYCVSIAQPGSSVNSAVHAFKTAWNAANPGDRVPIGTGTYEQATADALKRVLGAAPAACAPRTAASFLPDTLRAPQQEEGLSTSAIVGIGLLGVGAVGGAIYLATRESPAPPVRVRRVRPRPLPSRRPEPAPTWDPSGRPAWNRWNES